MRINIYAEKNPFLPEGKKFTCVKKGECMLFHTILILFKYSMKPNFVTTRSDGNEIFNLSDCREQGGETFYILFVYSRSLLYYINKFQVNIFTDGKTF